MTSRLTASSVFFVLAALAGFSLTSCSAIVNPDIGSLPPAPGTLDAGPVVETDLGPRDGGSDLGADLGGVPCTGATRCVDGEFIQCMGGLELRTACPLGCASGSATRCAQFVPSNLPADTFPSGTADLEVGAGEVVIIDVDGCDVDGIDTHVVPQSGASPLCVLVVRNLRVRAGGTLMALGARPLVVLASGDIEIAGTVDVSADQRRPGPGGGPGGGGPSLNGGGASGGGGGAHVEPFDDGGGAGGSLCGVGGVGGRGGAALGGLAGAAVVTELSPLIAGSGGGSGRGSVAGTSTLGGSGGAGGGAFQLSAFGRIRLSGELLSGGGGGGGGGLGSVPGANWGSGGGAGSGGAVLIEAPTIEVTVTARLVVAGGGGGGAAAGARAGTNGGDGTATPPAAAGAGGGGPYDASGGAGALRTLDGASGGSNTMSTANGGGGGGGSGCIVARTGDATFTGGSAVSTPPSALRMLLARRR